jgi:hypothetical protein
MVLGLMLPKKTGRCHVKIPGDWDFKNTGRFDIQGHANVWFAQKAQFKKFKKI